MNDEFNKKVFVRDIKREFNLTQVSGDEDSLSRWVIAPDVNRPGLELAGYTRMNDLKRITVIGNKEIDFIKSLSYEVQRQRFDTITDGYTPCIVVTAGNEAPEALIELARHKNFPLFTTKERTHRFTIQVIAYLDECLAPFDSVHAVMMNIHGVGVLLRGESGVGKSEIALDLIHRGHMLVADDRVDIFRIHNDLVCKAPELLKNMIEIRGVGVLDLSLAFGPTSTLDRSGLDLVIDLVSYDTDAQIDRLGLDNKQTIDILGITKPVMKIPVKEGRAMSVIVESAVANYRLLERGYDSGEIFNKRVIEFINKNREF